MRDSIATTTGSSRWMPIRPAARRTSSSGRRRVTAAVTLALAAPGGRGQRPLPQRQRRTGAFGAGLVL